MSTSETNMNTREANTLGYTAKLSIERSFPQALARQWRGSPGAEANSVTMGDGRLADVRIHRDKGRWWASAKFHDSPDDIGFGATSVEEFASTAREACEKLARAIKKL